MLDCRHRLPSPELAGRTTWEQLRKDREKYPHLRPCPRILGSRGTWQWVNRSACEVCREAREKANGMA